MRQLAELGLPGSAMDHKSIAQAITKRTDDTFLQETADGDADPWANLEQVSIAIAMMLAVAILALTIRAITIIAFAILALLLSQYSHLQYLHVQFSH